MPLWIAAFLHHLPLDAVHPQWSSEAAFAVLDQGRVAALTPAAEAAGIRLDMRRAGAAAIAPEVPLCARDPAAEQQALHEVALALLQYTPDIALAEPDSLLLQVEGSLMYFGGPRRLYRRIVTTLHGMGIHTTIGMAPTAQGAWLLAHQLWARAPRRTLQRHTLARRLDRLPGALLPGAQVRLDWLRSIGCHTLGDLRQLPRAGLQRRCGVALVEALDAAYGDTPECHVWLQPPARFQQRLELPDYIEHAESVLFWAQRLIEPLCGWLNARRRAIQHFTLTLEHERGRHARPPTTLPVSLAQPAWQAAHLLTLLREKLGRLPLEAPAIALALRVDDTVDQPAVSTCLFPEPGGSPADHARLLDLLSARLGHERVRCPQPIEDHRPEAANGWVAAGDSPSHLASPSATAVAAGKYAPFPLMDRPFWLLDPPMPLSIRQHRPVYAGQPLRLVRGPERIESGWWDGALTVRDYFVAEDAARARYWIYRERDTEHARWFLHGRYG